MPAAKGQQRLTGPPDFIGVGTQCSGTTWRFKMLLTHPDIRAARGGREEQHFFDKFGAREMTRADVEAYMSDIATRGRYASQLRNLFEFFDPDQVLVLQVERCRADPLGEYARTLRFLGLRDDFEPFTRLRSRAARAARKLLKRERTVELWPDIEQALRAELEPEMADLKVLVPDLDFSLWPAFADLAAPSQAPVAERV